VNLNKLWLNFFFRYCDSIKYLISINEMYISDTNGKVLLKQKTIKKPKPFTWIKTVDNLIVNNDNSEIAKIESKSIYIDENEWEVEQTKENGYSLNKQITSEKDNNKIEFQELGQWRVTNMARSIIFDGARFIDSESVVKGSVRLFPNQRILFDTYCELELNLPNDYITFAFLIFILNRYADYILMGHNIWTA